MGNSRLKMIRTPQARRSWRTYFIAALDGQRWSYQGGHIAAEASKPLTY